MEELLKESLHHLEKIPKGDHKLILLILKIKKHLNLEKTTPETRSMH